MKFFWFIFVTWIIIQKFTYAISFEETLNIIETNDLVQSSIEKGKMLSEESISLSSWGDPKFSVAAINYPKDSLDSNKSMMTGIKFSLAQTIPLSNKNTDIFRAAQEKSSSQKAQAKQLIRKYAKEIWSLAIEKQKYIKIEKILKENLSWISDNLKITNRLYSTGKVPQSAVLNMQMRKSELNSKINNNQFSQNSLDLELTTILNSKSTVKLDLKSIPWDYLDSWMNSKSEFDFNEIVLKHELESSRLKLHSKNKNLIPDITLGVAYIKRNDLDKNGDFVEAGITIPLPISSTRYANKRSAIHENIAQEKIYKNYTQTRPLILSKIKNDILDLEDQISILHQQTLQYAKSARDIIAKSYARGGDDFSELLRSELQYQNLLMNEVNLITNIQQKKINYLFINGDHLTLRGLK
ncbi:MAG: TolC family protein [Halobacteriovoraceae bacterium]|nr:TolC family protein [Halobacteriovoraceae bacterium]